MHDDSERALAGLRNDAFGRFDPTASNPEFVLDRSPTKHGRTGARFRLPFSSRRSFAPLLRRRIFDLEQVLRISSLSATLCDSGLKHSLLRDILIFIHASKPLDPLQNTSGSTSSHVIFVFIQHIRMLSLSTAGLYQHQPISLNLFHSQLLAAFLFAAAIKGTRISLR